MKVTRVIAAAFMVFLGAMLIVVWAISGRVVERIDSGEAASNLTEKLLAEPQVAEGVATRLQAELEAAVADTPLRFLLSAFDQEIHDAIVSVLTSERVTNAVTESVGRLEAQITDEITDPDRAEGPFVVTIDPTERINNRLDEIPVVGFLIPDVTVEPKTIELIDATTFEDVRSIYKLLNVVAVWSIWVALALIIGGFWVAPRSKWYWAQAAVGAGFIVIAVAFAMGKLVPSTLANAAPGGAEGGAGKFLSEFVSENSINPMVRLLFSFALIALALAVIFALVARFLPKREESADAELEVDVPEPALVGAAVVPAVVELDASTTNDQPATVVPAVIDPVVVEPVVVEPVVVEPVPAPKKPVAKKPAAKKPATAKATPAKKPTTASGTAAKPSTRSRAQKPKPPTE